MRTCEKLVGIGRGWMIYILWLCILGLQWGWAPSTHAASPGHGVFPDEREAGFAPSIQAVLETGIGIVYAGSFGNGVFESQNEGRSWNNVSGGLRDLFVLCLAEGRHGEVYAGTLQGGVFRLKDKGGSWESIRQGLKRVEVKSLLVNGDDIYAGTGRGVYRWIKNEQHWEPVASGLDQVLVSSLVMLDNRTLLAGTAGKGLYQYDTLKSGKTEWVKAGDNFVDPKERLSHKFIRIVAVGNNQQVYVGTQDGGIFQSKDFGKTWHPMGRSLPNDSIRGIVGIPNGLFVATGRGVYKLSPTTKRWISVNTGLTDLSVQALIGNSQGVLYAGTSEGAFRSNDGGEHWVDVSEGFGRQLAPPRPFFYR